MKQEIDYVVEQHCSNGMIVKEKYINDRIRMLREYPNVNKENFLVIEDENSFCRYNEISGKKMIWSHIYDKINSRENK